MKNKIYLKYSKFFFIYNNNSKCNNNCNLCNRYCYVFGPTGPMGPTGPAVAPGWPTGRLVKSSNINNYNFKLYSFINLESLKDSATLIINSKEQIICEKIKSLLRFDIRSTRYKDISEKVLKRLILEDIDNFLKELGNGFCYIENEYKIKIGDRYNYIDLLLFNYIYNCFIVVELKVTELKKEHIGQIQTYMNYIDKNIKKLTHDKTIGIIIVKKDNKLILEYSSDSRIYSTTYITN